MPTLVRSQWYTFVILAAAAGCPAPVPLVSDGVAPPDGVPPPGDVSQPPPLTGMADGTLAIDPAMAAQVIDGFGGANAWSALPSDPTARARVVDLLFSRSKGAGLSILRNRIPFREQSGNGGSIPDYNDRFLTYTSTGDYQSVVNPDGSKTFSLDWTNWDLGNTRALLSEIAARGDDAGLAMMFSTPWTPPNNATTNWKIDVPDPVNYPQIGGSLDPAHYADYADVLADYANGFADHMGVPLAAISIQNEPDWKADYESCAWTAAQVHDFLAVMKVELANKPIPPGVRILAPEGTNFDEALVRPSLDDPATADVVGVVGVHQYDYSDANFAAKLLPTVESHRKPLWMTEVSQGSANDSSITDGIYWARMIHTDLTLAQVNAFNYWWLWAASASKAALLGVDGSTVTENKRLFALGQYSRFVRPGWIRIAAATAPAAGILSSAFRDPDGKTLAVVLINTGTEARTVDLQLAAGGYGALAAWRTSATESLAEVGAVSVDATVARVAVPAQSVTTIYGAISR
jgi:O-glycosyl hydrolase